MQLIVKRKLAEMKIWRDNRVRTPEQVEQENEKKRKHHYDNRERNNIRRSIALITERYNVNYEVALDLFHRSTGSCDCCGKVWTPDMRRLAIDHDHNTGKVRGILCHPCNASLGFMEESHERINKLSHYLEEVCGIKKE